MWVNIYRAFKTSIVWGGWGVDYIYLVSFFCHSYIFLNVYYVTAEAKYNSQS